MTAGSWTELVGSIVTLAAFIFSIYIFRKDSKESQIKNISLQAELNLSYAQNQYYDNKKRLKEIRSCKVIIGVLETRINLILPTSMTIAAQDRHTAESIANERLEVIKFGESTAGEVYFILSALKDLEDALITRNSTDFTKARTKYKNTVKLQIEKLDSEENEVLKNIKEFEESLTK